MKLLHRAATSLIVIDVRKCLTTLQLLRHAERFVLITLCRNTFSVALP